MVTKRPGVVSFSENYDFADTVDESGTKVTRCMVRHSKLMILNEDGSENGSFNVHMEQLSLLSLLRMLMPRLCLLNGIHTPI